MHGAPVAPPLRESLGLIDAGTDGPWQRTLRGAGRDHCPLPGEHQQEHHPSGVSVYYYPLSHRPSSSSAEYT
eukprot:COSAG02_NODE_47132_length_343_cov_1.016393_1_plen_71_part_10